MGEPAILRVDELDHPPEIGRFYLVPTIRYPLCHVVADWPVLGVKHADAEHFRFPHDHYHIDTRFMTCGLLRKLRKRDRKEVLPGQASRLALCWRDSTGGLEFSTLPHPPVEYRRLKCVTPVIAYPFGGVPQVLAFREALADVSLLDTKHGPVCPHRGFRMGAIAPDENGVLTCPLHGLQFCARSGKAIAPNGEGAGA
jgi:hypothetical protein